MMNGKRVFVAMVDRRAGNRQVIRSLRNLGFETNNHSRICRSYSDAVLARQVHERGGYAENTKQRHHCTTDTILGE